MLPQEFKPKGLFDLVRVGKDNDGGYLICKTSLKESEYLLSFGISDEFITRFVTAIFPWLATAHSRGSKIIVKNCKLNRQSSG